MRKFILVVCMSLLLGLGIGAVPEAQAGFLTVISITTDKCEVDVPNVGKVSSSNSKILEIGGNRVKGSCEFEVAESDRPNSDISLDGLGCAIYMGNRTLPTTNTQGNLGKNGKGKVTCTWGG